MFIPAFLRNIEKPHWWAAAVVAGSALLHLLVIGRFDLGVDEAHYALYGMMPDWSYFDHPPMVGWLQALIVPLSQSEFALRLWPVLLSVLAGYLIYRLPRELFPDAPPWLGLLSVVILHSALIFQLLAMALVPDGPLLVFGLASAIYIFHALNDNRLRDWLMVGLLFGLAGLSKYTAVTLVATVIVYLVSERRWRVLVTPGPWLAAVLALILISPILYWNATHDWLSFSYQLGHGAPDRGWSLLRFIRSELVQVFAYAPGIVIFGVVAVWATMRHGSSRGSRFSLALSLPILLLFGWGAGFEMTLPHWPILAWAGLIPLIANWLVDAWRRRWVRIVGWSSLAYSVVLGLALHVQLFTPWMPFEPYRHPLGDLYGWREAAEHAVALQEGLHDEEGAAPLLMVGNWSLGSRVAWYARPQPVVITDKRLDQFDLWYGSPAENMNGLLIVPDNYQDRPQTSGVAYFAECREIDRITVKHGDTPVHAFQFFDCRGYQG